MQEEFLENNNLEKNLLINSENIGHILDSLGKSYFKNELKEGRLGKRIIKAINLNKGVNISVILNWIHFIENSIKFIQKGKNYFEEIILAEHIENNFLFKMKKGNNTKSIGFFLVFLKKIKKNVMLQNILYNKHL